MTFARVITPVPSRQHALRKAINESRRLEEHFRGFMHTCREKELIDKIYLGQKGWSRQVPFPQNSAPGFGFGGSNVHFARIHVNVGFGLGSFCALINTSRTTNTEICLAL